MEKAAYRIIDANFNRAREASRVMEEYARFALNCGPLTGRAKQLRHELSTAIATLDTGSLLASRDTLDDVGVGQKVAGQLQRTTLKDGFTAAAKRLTEALRALSETIQSTDAKTAATIERLRYEAYTLEKDIALFAEPAEKYSRVRLYVVITSNLPAEVLSLTSRCAAGGADCIQLRAKDIPDDRLFALAVEFVDICREMGSLSVINDRIDIAAAAGADGVHLGQTDLPTEQVRRLQLTPLIVGKSTHSLKELNKTVPQLGEPARGTVVLPNYVSLGPVFPTPTKPKMDVAGFGYVREGLEHLAGTGVSHVAIGGITRDNVDQVIRAGAERIAVCSAITHAPDPTDACRRFKARITELLSA